MIFTFIKDRFNSSIIFDFILFVFGIFLFRVLKLFILYWCGYVYGYPLLMIVDGLWLSIIFGIIIYYILGIKLIKA